MIHPKVKKIVAIGGGTGLFALLNGIKHISNTSISAIVTMTDSGGSTGRLRDDFGYLPIGDVRQCIVALAEDYHSTQLLREIFLYRFNKGEGLRGHNLGNLFLTALTDILGSEEEAIKQVSKILKIKGKVIPVTNTNTHLIAEYEDGTIVKGEGKIDEPEKNNGKIKITNVWLQPNAIISDDAKKALLQADLIILGPGDVYTSIVPNLLVQGVAETLQKIDTPLLYFVNLFSKLGQTYKMNTKEHVAIIERYLTYRKLTHIVYNNRKIPEDIEKLYIKSNEYPVLNDLPNDLRIIREDLLSYTINKTSAADLKKKSYSA